MIERDLAEPGGPSPYDSEACRRRFAQHASARGGGYPTFLLLVMPLRHLRAELFLRRS